VGALLQLHTTERLYWTKQCHNTIIIQMHSQLLIVLGSSTSDLNYKWSRANQETSGVSKYTATFVVFITKETPMCGAMPVKPLGPSSVTNDGQQIAETPRRKHVMRHLFLEFPSPQKLSYICMHKQCYKAVLWNKRTFS